MPQLLSEASDQLRGSLEAEVAIVMAGNPLKAAEAPLIGEGLVGGERSGRGLSHRSGIFSVDRPQNAAGFQLSRAPRGLVADPHLPIWEPGSTRRPPRLPQRHPLRLAGAVASVGVGSTLSKAGFLQRRFSCLSRR
jgi:hypothetical protein